MRACSFHWVGKKARAQLMHYYCMLKWKLGNKAKNPSCYHRDVTNKCLLCVKKLIIRHGKEKDWMEKMQADCNFGRSTLP